MRDNEDNNEPFALFLAFCCIGSIYGIIVLIGMILEV
jgi:hypothetical protein